MEELAAPDGAGLEITLYQAVPKGGRMDLRRREGHGSRGHSYRAGVGRAWRREPARGRSAAGGWPRRRRARRCGSACPMWPSPYDSRTPSWRWKGTGILLHNAPALRPVEAVVGVPASLFVGRRAGGGELRLAEEAGISFGGLGPYRLRSETAGIIAVARTLAALESRVER